MDLVRFGRGIRAPRHRRRWRQVDLAPAARVSQSVVARIERGAADNLPPRKIDAVAAALGARTELRLSWNGEALDRLLDAGHAALVDVVATLLRPKGWEVAVEATFAIRGERGSIDILAWHSTARTLLVIEVKSVVPDIQAMLAAIDRKLRLAREIGRDRGWTPATVSALLVIGEDRTARRRVDAHATTFVEAFLSALMRSDAGPPLRTQRRCEDAGSCQPVMA